VGDISYIGYRELYRVSRIYPSLYLVCGAQVTLPLSLPCDDSEDVQHKGSRPLTQQEEAPVLSSLQPGCPEAQSPVHIADVMQQSANHDQLALQWDGPGIIRRMQTGPLPCKRKPVHNRALESGFSEAQKRAVSCLFC